MKLKSRKLKEIFNNWEGNVSKNEEIDFKDPLAINSMVIDGKDPLADVNVSRVSLKLLLT